jgi:hypothetical protein
MIEFVWAVGGTCAACSVVDAAGCSCGVGGCFCGVFGCCCEQLCGGENWLEKVDGFPCGRPIRGSRTLLTHFFGSAGTDEEPAPCRVGRPTRSPSVTRWTGLGKRLGGRNRHGPSNRRPADSYFAGLHLSGLSINGGYATRRFSGSSAARSRERSSRAESRAISVTASPAAPATMSVSRSAYRTELGVGLPRDNSQVPRPPVVSTPRTTAGAEVADCCRRNTRNRVCSSTPRAASDASGRCASSSWSEAPTRSALEDGLSQATADAGEQEHHDPRQRVA